MNKEISLIFPHQLFEKTIHLNKNSKVFIIEEYLFFTQYKFHKQKITFHRATMKFYENYLCELGYDVEYIEADNPQSDIRVFLKSNTDKINRIHIIDPTDNWLIKRIKKFGDQYEFQFYQNPLFLNSTKDLDAFFKPSKKKFFQTKFYIEQRKKRNILLEAEEKPVGGKWSYDADNRKKYPRGKEAPAIDFPEVNSFYQEAIHYTNNNFSGYPGAIDIEKQLYPIDFNQTRAWLQQFISQRFEEFGIYEDAIVDKEHFLNHAVLTPMLNVGLVTPQQILDAVIDQAEAHNIPLNSLEGFIRQIIGWREFIRGIYEVKGSYERTLNYWNFDRKIPASFYDGTTGIEPVDQTIRKILKTGYCHHIERLMILGNFMLICEFDPDEVYRWFMELFIDAYDWVMVPNVYGMSQFADGGLMSTKPYFSSSNYIKKMSNYDKGDWQQIWDGLFWRFMHHHRTFFMKNPRMGMLLKTFDKMDETKRSNHLMNAESFLEKLDG